VAKVGTGEALNKRAVAGRLGLKLSTVESAIRRTRLGVAAVAFPDADGYAIDPESGRSVMVPYWYERKIIAYGKATGALDRYGSIVD
jgi:hypothetical protein